MEREMYGIKWENITIDKITYYYYALWFQEFTETE
jgi:hypothetical protein